jgi:hypothetical protein
MDDEDLNVELQQLEPGNLSVNLKAPQLTPLNHPQKLPKPQYQSQEDWPYLPLKIIVFSIFKISKFLIYFLPLWIHREIIFPVSPISKGGLRGVI